MKSNKHIEALVKSFADSIERSEKAVEAGDATMANTFGKKYANAAAELLASDLGIEAFASLLQDRRNSVKVASAAYLLPYRASEAIPI